MLTQGEQQQQRSVSLQEFLVAVPSKQSQKNMGVGQREDMTENDTAFGREKKSTVFSSGLPLLQGEATSLLPIEFYFYSI